MTLTQADQPDREVINHITGPSGNWTQMIPQHDIDTLETLGIIRKVRTTSNATWETRFWEKA